MTSYMASLTKTDFELRAILQLRKRLTKKTQIFRLANAKRVRIIKFLHKFSIFNSVTRGETTLIFRRKKDEKV